jgi:hypothetical protein
MVVLYCDTDGNSTFALDQAVLKVSVVVGLVERRRKVNRSRSVLRLYVYNYMKPASEYSRFRSRNPDLTRYLS